MKKRTESYQDLKPGLHTVKGGRYADETSVHIRDHLRKTEDVIKALRKDLDRYRSQNVDLLRERNDLSRLIDRLESNQRDRDSLQNEMGFIKNERDRLAREIDPLQAENERLAEHCARLEASLAEERRQREQAQQVIVSLEEQISELESMVDLLRDHDSFASHEE
jgi:chromosome segregation ATPase